MQVVLVTSMLKHDMVEAVRRELVSRGFSARVMTDKNFDLNGVDCAVTVGTGLALPRFTRALERLEDDRCAHISWVTEPLPPDGITASMLSLSRWMSPGRWGQDSLRPILHGISRPILKAMLTLQNHQVGDTDARLVRYCCDNLGWLDRGAARGFLDLVAASTQKKRQQLAASGFSTIFLPVPHHDGFGRELGLDRTIDVLFIGRLRSSLRNAALAELKTDLEMRGRSVRIVTSNLYGEERTRLVNSARVMLHLHQFPSDTPWTRWHIATANGAAMVSEPLVCPEPFRPDRDYLSAPRADLAGAIDAMLAEEARRSNMVAACRRTIERSMSMGIVADQLCTEIARAVDARRNARVR